MYALPRMYVRMYTSLTVNTQNDLPKHCSMTYERITKQSNIITQAHYDK